MSARRRSSGHEIVVPQDVLDDLRAPHPVSERDVEAFARVLPGLRADRQRLEIVVRHEQLAPEAPPVVAEPSRAIPWALIAVAFLILVFSCFAAWHTMRGPQIHPVRSHPVDLVSPSR
jgi:hypothetical protein